MAILKELNINYIIYPFDIHGSDERQFSSPGFKVPIGTITKDKYYEYSYYHTSLDNLNFISEDSLQETLDIYKHIIKLIEASIFYVRTTPHCEPMLGKRNLYSIRGGY